eukprot:EG_transcript_9381
MELPLVDEVLALSSASVLYEMALYRLQRPWQRPACTPGRLAALMHCFEETLRCFDWPSLLLECRLLFRDHLEAGLSRVHFRPALELLLPLDQPPDPDALVPPARWEELTGATGCVVEEVDRERWVFRDVAEDRLPQRSVSNDGGGVTARLHVGGGDAKLAYSVALCVWAGVRLLARRIELLLEFPADHPLLKPSQGPAVPKVSALGDGLEALLRRRREVSQRAVHLCGQGDWQAALDALTHALALHPEGEEGQYAMLQQRAHCHLHLRQPERTVDDCTAALRCNPHAYLARYYRAQAYEELGRSATALEDVTQLLRLFPDSCQADAFRARLCASQGTPDSGCRCLCEEPTFIQDVASPFPAEPSSESPASPHTPLTPSSGRASVSETRRFEPGVQGGASAGGLADGREGDRGQAPGGGGRDAGGIRPSLVLEAHERHPHAGAAAGTGLLPHIVLEYCPGGTLRSLANGLRGLPPPLMRKYATEVLRGLRYMHGHGLLHRDVK